MAEEDLCYAPIKSKLNFIGNIFGSSSSKKYYSKNYSLGNKMNRTNNNDKFEKLNDLQKIIMSQDIVEGFWEENIYTKNIKNKLKDVFIKISNFIDSNEKIKEKNKVKFTFIILYYLINQEKQKLNENKLIINKGKKYLNSNNTSYDEIISFI